jgi:ABC-type molybdenum transport system ATPase subunit/photorepair protein PhrA
MLRRGNIFRQAVAELMRRGGRFVCVLHHDEDALPELDHTLELEGGRFSGEV